MLRVQKKIVLLVLILSMIDNLVFGQKPDTIRSPSHFSGTIAVTNNGISLIPTFSLNKPAILFNLSLGKGRFSFEPDMRFALEGKPWSFIFWSRYRIRADKFLFTMGAHPALNFRSQVSPVDGSEMIVTRRFLAGELAPSYFLSKNVTAGMYYLYSHCFYNGAARNTHFVTINSSFRNIRLGSQFYFQFTPQFYYLNQDGLDGYYFTAALAVAKRKFPFSIQSIINKEIHSDIIGSRDFVWNLSVVFSFNKNYVAQK